jgi:hypothetical protein
MRGHAGLGHLLGHVPPARAAFQSERHLTEPVEPGQPAGQMFPIGRRDPAAFPLTVLLVHPIEGQLLPVNIDAAYD